MIFGMLLRRRHVVRHVIAGIFLPRRVVPKRVRIGIVVVVSVSGSIESTWIESAR